MKIFKHNVLVASIITCFASTSFAQTTTSGLFATGHTALGFQQPTHYLGWQNNAIPLYFRTGNHNGNQNRMLIRNGGFGLNAGRIAIGNNLPNNFIPTSRLHLHQDGQNRIGFTNSTTLTTGTDGFQIGINNAGQALIRQRENQSIRIFTDNTQRMRINPTLTNQTINGFTGINTSGYIGIGTNSTVFNAPPNAGHIPYFI